MSDPVSPASPETSPEAAPEITPEITASTLAKMRKRFLWTVSILAVLYFNIYLFPMMFNTLIPFFALAGIGFVLGFALPRQTNAASWCVFGLVLVAAIVRRIQTLDMPLAGEIFGGALAQGGYPPWAAWLAELLRLRVYLAAVRLGTRLGSQLRTLPSDEGAGA